MVNVEGYGSENRKISCCWDRGSYGGDGRTSIGEWWWEKE